MSESPAERLNQCEMRSETAKPNRQGMQDNDDYFLSFRFSRFSVRRVYVYVCVCVQCALGCVCVRLSFCIHSEMMHTLQVQLLSDRSAGLRLNNRRWPPRCVRSTAMESRLWHLVRLFATPTHTHSLSHTEAMGRCGVAFSPFFPGAICRSPVPLSRRKGIKSISFETNVDRLINLWFRLNTGWDGV